MNCILFAYGLYELFYIFVVILSLSFLLPFLADLNQFYEWRQTFKPLNTCGGGATGVLRVLDS